MDSFKKYCEVSYQQNHSDIEDTLKKIPKKHKELLNKYNIKFLSSNGLKGDEEHVGSLDMNKKDITIAAPWNYGREWTLLHEIGHLVYDKYLLNNPKLKKQWEDLVAKTSGKANQNAEELFCHGYANVYALNKIEKHNHPKWDEFIKHLV